MNIGLLGFGVVGRGVYELTATREDVKVKKVVCLEDIRLPDAEVTRDFKAVLEDQSIDTVVEAMGGLHPAYEFVRAAIEAGKHVVTSNKALVATFYDELIPLAKEKGVSFRCTAAVGGGIGWLSELERTRRVQEIQSVGGIMNGTCNYILDSMTRLGISYDDALSQAQKLGYAEAKPATDVEGIDTYHKLILSVNIAFGVSVDKSTIPVAGISRIQAEDIKTLGDHGRVCKLVSYGAMADGKLSAFVQPAAFDRSALEAAVQANFNLITFTGSASGVMRFYGQGAGRYPTAYNVVQDCKDLLDGKGFYSPYGGRVKAQNSGEMTFYVRGELDSLPEAWIGERWGSAVVTKPVSVSAMHGWLKEHTGAFMAAMV